MGFGSPMRFSFSRRVFMASSDTLNRPAMSDRSWHLNQADLTSAAGMRTCPANSLATRSIICWRRCSSPVPR
jgi:hypothetical protein